MVDSIKLTTFERTSFGKGAARKLRREGRIPAVVYGSSGQTSHIALDAHETFLAVRGNANALLTVKIDGKDQLTLAKDVQRHPVSWDIEHIDLLQIKAGEKVEVTVPVITVGEPAPGTVVTTEVLEMLVTCDVLAIPQAVEIDVEGKEEGTQIRVADIALPDGVSTDLDPEELLVSVNFPIVDEELEAADAEVAEAQSEEDEQADSPADEASEGEDEEA